ncbi:hypothetical protein CDL15_Pgr027245 [Punica granatum]|uniref:Uncharacterized protein n=1 Tax=Punica granatum TaxID=22663 RepID=A0A218Y3I9_PUNGR|nr:hypothetical protein CDL15_Pgr027245 [Punica granatum]
MHGEAALADLQQARVSGLGELAKLKRKDARVADSVDLQKKGCMDEHTRQICKMHESADSANLRSVKGCTGD